jgi:hypothetical protein
LSGVAVAVTVTAGVVRGLDQLQRRDVEILLPALGTAQTGHVLDDQGMDAEPMQVAHQRGIKALRSAVQAVARSRRYVGSPADHARPSRLA